MKIIARGAEATIYDNKDIVIKYRKRKGYRLKEIDETLRYSRTQREFNALKRCHDAGVRVPIPMRISDDGDRLYMEKINAAQLDYRFSPLVMSGVGDIVAMMHKAGVIHGDLTTANMLMNGKKITLIDFGLGYFSKKDEDRATDIAMLKSALKSRHVKVFKQAYQLFIRHYKKRIGKEFKGIETHLRDIERRRRYYENG
jgi:TP53 regulating kinase-like protein